MARTKRPAAAPKPRPQLLKVTIAYDGDAYAIYDCVRALLGRLDDPRFVVRATTLK